MTHILFECDARGQKTVWALTQKIWELTGIGWITPTWGSTVGAACAVFKDAKGARRTAREQLWCILCTEAVHLIWKMRCERVIQKEGAEFNENEVTNRFYATLNSRLVLDRRTAARALSKRALQPEEVDLIWSPVIENYTSLPHNWVVDSGVLVGIKRGR